MSMVMIELVRERLGRPDEAVRCEVHFDEGEPRLASELEISDHERSEVIKRATEVRERRCPR